MLPGKLCIGILEEDNPLKSYFRLKPLLIENGGRYAEFEEADEYPEDGCLRIVPDKNESSHFKARMRRMGRFCVLDLREHALENDKIRPNKNYRGDETERNAHIVYSDVVREAAEDMIFEIADAQAGDPWPVSGAEKIALPNLEICTQQDGVIASAGVVLAEEEIQRFEFRLSPDEKLRFAIRLPGTVPSVTGSAESHPEPVRRAVQETPPVRQEPEIPAKEAAQIDIQQPEPVKERGIPSPLEGQTGLNPRRSRSLQEIIEEKWRHSRVDQLGHPVPVNAMGSPIQDPVEAAVGAIGSAWENPELHPRLIAAIADMEAFSTALEGRRKAVMNSEIRRELEDLEAERLKTLSELDRLRRDKQELREHFKEEIRQEEADALRECVEKTRAAQADYQRIRMQAEDARIAVEKLDDIYASITDGRLEDRLRDFAVTSRAAKLFAENLQAAAPKSAPSRESISADEWIERMQRAFAAEGLTLDREHAANLLVCAALGNVLFLSGGASADKAAAARAIAKALGLGKRGVILRGFNRTQEVFHDFEPDRFYLCEVADAGSGFPLCAELLQQGMLIRLDPPPQDAAWHVNRSEAEEIPETCPEVLKNAFLRDAAALPAVIENRMKNLRAALGAHGVYLSAGVLERTWNYCAAMTGANIMTPEDALDRAFAQYALPCALAEAPVKCLAEMREILTGMEKCAALLDSRAPVLIG